MFVVLVIYISILPTVSGAVGLRYLLQISQYILTVGGELGLRFLLLMFQYHLS